MSTHYTVRCDLCGVNGPEIRRQAGGTLLIGYPRELPETGWSNGSGAWSDFLLDHEDHGNLLLQQSE